MVEYLKEYKKLLELKEINEQEIKEIQSLIDENLQKGNETTEQEVTINLELQNINKEYEDKFQEKKKKINNKINITIVIINLIVVLAVAISTHPIFLLPTAYILTLTDGTLKAISILILDKTKFIEKRLTKDEKTIKLIEQIKTKEKELSSIKELINEYVQKVIQYRSKLKKLQEKENWYDESINELMRNYATPIFEEQLKHYQEAEKEENSEVKEEQPKRKTRSQIIREKHKLI